ncbi:PIN domain-containing protein [Halalkalicoccus sp. NIPERK01]|uniref:PIN domain-containing protein n=1 Tax=Halalkalicoccus sp. NIPERK01 TaxID=3053469 RepID=UPI00256EB56C|nr:PIN domain-containing protein [Halalkalicoccus sp. NIPERK01]MDL5362103.1 PIN domain-containing protein [Halalkalicoccus sp. NIPERK01]
MILDTAFVIDLIDGDPGAIEKARTIEEGGIVLRVPAMVLLELYIGVEKVAETSEEERQVRRVVDSLPKVEMNETIAMRAGRIIGRLRTEDLTLGKGDAAIGATGLVFDEPVLTRNTSDFERIPELVVKTY